MQKWNFLSSSKEEIEAFYDSFTFNEPLDNLIFYKAFLIDKDVNLRGRLKDEDSKDGKLYGYNMNSVSELNGKLKDDIKVFIMNIMLLLKKKQEQS